MRVSEPIAGGFMRKCLPSQIELTGTLFAFLSTSTVQPVSYTLDTRATLPLLFIPISQHEVLPPVHPSNLPRILEDALVIGLDNAGQTTLLKPDGAPFIAIHTCVSAEKRYATLLEARFKWRRGSRRKGKTVEEAQWQAAESLFSAGCQRLTEALSMC
jgi:hypothetical protein